MSQLGGEDFPVIKLYDTVRVLAFELSGYVACVVGDIGKDVLGATTGDTGVLLEYNNTTRVWKVRPDDNDDIFSEVETVSVVNGGTGSGTTTGASTKELRIKEKYEFSGRDYGKVIPDCPPDLDGPTIRLDKGTKKKYRRGYDTNFSVLFIFDNDNPGKSKDFDGNDLNDCQTFLLNLLNHNDIIKLQPHSDKTEQYEVTLVKGFNFKEAFERSYGWRGKLEFEGMESIPELDFKK